MKSDLKAPLTFVDSTPSRGLRPASCMLAILLMFAMACAPWQYLYESLVHVVIKPNNMHWFTSSGKDDGDMVRPNFLKTQLGPNKRPRAISGVSHSSYPDSQAAPVLLTECKKNIWNKLRCGAIGAITGLVTGAGVGTATGAAFGAVASPFVAGAGAAPGAAVGMGLGGVGGAINGGLDGIMTAKTPKDAFVDGIKDGIKKGTAGTTDSLLGD